MSIANYWKYDNIYSFSLNTTDHMNEMVGFAAARRII